MIKNLILLFNYNNRFRIGGNMRKIKMQRVLATTLLSLIFGTTGIGVAEAVVEYQNKLDAQVSVIDEQSLQIKELEKSIETLRNEKIQLETEKEDIVSQLDELVIQHATLEANYNELVQEPAPAPEPVIEDTVSDISSNDNDIEILYRIARAEAGDWDKQAIKDVVYVILNRVVSPEFPDTIEGVVFAPRQFSPISNGTYYTVEVTDFVKDAVDEAYNDYENSHKSYGALYFASNNVILGEHLFDDSIHHFYR